MSVRAVSRRLLEASACVAVCCAWMNPLTTVTTSHAVLCSAAVVRVQVLPPRCTAAVHTAAVQHAVQQYTSAAAGPAALELQEQLVACCLQVWQDGRQQCSQLSLTGG
jgi:hypothetical protein